MDAENGSMEFVDPGRDARRFRTALSRFATGVTVVTAPSAEGPAGITANSFASVSLDPPLVLWSPAKASARYPIFRDAPRFAVHVLDAHQQSICDGFTHAQDAFDGLDWHLDEAGVPILADCLARFDCAREAVHDAGDHAIVVARVRSAAFRDGLPLLFQAGRFVAIKG